MLKHYPKRFLSTLNLRKTQEDKMKLIQIENLIISTKFLKKISLNKKDDYFCKNNMKIKYL